MHTINSSCYKYGMCSNQIVRVQLNIIAFDIPKFTIMYSKCNIDSTMDWTCYVQYVTSAMLLQHIDLNISTCIMVTCRYEVCSIKLILLSCACN